MNTKIKILFFSILATTAFFIAVEANAQCAMCKAVIESNSKNGGNSVGSGINDGILYILGIPYLLIGAVGFIIYRHNKKFK